MGACWIQPGFHNFWRVWSPPAGFVLCRLYLLLGGRQHRSSALVATFLFSGFVFHDVPLMLIRQKPLLVCTGAWAFFGVATLLSARFVRPGLPTVAYLALNVSLIASGFWLGLQLDRLVLGAHAA